MASSERLISLVDPLSSKQEYALEKLRKEQKVSERKNYLAKLNSCFGKRPPRDLALLAVDFPNSEKFVLDYINNSGRVDKSAFRKAYNLARADAAIRDLQ